MQEAPHPMRQAVASGWPGRAGGASGAPWSIWLARARRLWPLWLGLAALTASTLAMLLETSWSVDPYGPIILALSLWLMARAWPAGAAAPGSPVRAAGWLVPALLLYAIGRVATSTWSRRPRSGR